MQGLVSDYKIVIKHITKKIGNLGWKAASSYLLELPLSPFWPWGNISFKIFERENVNWTLTGI